MRWRGFCGLRRATWLAPTGSSKQSINRALARAQNLKIQLELLATKGAVAIDRFEEYQSGQGVSARDGGRGIGAAGLAGIQTVTNQQAFLRKQAPAPIPSDSI